MKTITVAELKAKQDANEDFQLIDVREPYEIDICSLNGDAMPMGEIINRVDEISKDKTVIIHCRSGKRSAAVIEALERNHGFENLYNLTGGILAYAAEIDTSLEQY
ncbi:rhodanese-like domain-containing protein [Flavobacteriales bacterium]|jgi:adenylyltransferase/sulfurtransferase|nr:rhodanese-like domain-containing protein [Flavobacteriales bacterium]